MMFAAWTSAYVVRQAAGNWLEFRLPDIFFYNTIVIVLSSVALQGSYIAFKREKEFLYKSLLILATLLGFAFVCLQYVGWTELRNIGIELTTNPSGSFIYVLTPIPAKT